MPDLDYIIDALIDNDPAIMKPLYDKTSAKLNGVITRILDNPKHAKIALHKTYLSIWKQRAALRYTTQSPIDWMTHIARQNALAYRVDSSELSPLLSDISSLDTISIIGWGTLDQNDKNLIVAAYLDAVPIPQLAHHYQTTSEAIQQRLIKIVSSLRNVSK